MKNVRRDLATLAAAAVAVTPLTGCGHSSTKILALDCSSLLTAEEAAAANSKIVTVSEALEKNDVERELGKGSRVCSYDDATGWSAFRILLTPSMSVAEVQKLWGDSVERTSRVPSVGSQGVCLDASPEYGLLWSRSDVTMVLVDEGHGEPSLECAGLSRMAQEVDARLK